MPWATNTKNQKVESALSPAAKTVFNTWAKTINSGKDPKTAANFKDADYEVLKKSGDLKFCSIRLSKEHRVYFVQNDKTQVCEVRKVGSHKPPAGF